MIKLNKYILLPLLVILTWSFCQGQGHSITAISFNIRYDNPNDGPDNWNMRKADLVSTMLELTPWVLGIQEGLHHQVQYLNQGLKAYKYVGVGRDDGKTNGEYCAIFYDTGQLTPLRSGTFWLSDTPDTISVGWDASMERICSYALFQITGGSRFWVFNTHFDHKGPEARENSARLILAQIEKMNIDFLPVILMGDFNATPEEPPIRLISQQLTDAGNSLQIVQGRPTGTFNGFRGNAEQRRIDFIFVSGMQVESYLHLDARTESNRNLSDHLPVVGTFSIP